MKHHTKLYMDFFGYDEGDFIPSELSGRQAVDVNHIDARGMGGNPSGDKDNIKNLMALTREEHLEYGDKTKYKALLHQIHEFFMETRRPFLNHHVIWDSELGVRIGKF